MLVLKHSFLFTVNKYVVTNGKQKACTRIVGKYGYDDVARKSISGKQIFPEIFDVRKSRYFSFL